MAELGLAVAQTLFAALQCSELNEICSIWGYKSQLEDLKQTVTTVNSVLKDAESQELSYEQRGYIKELRDAVYEADDLFDEFVTRLELKQLRDESPSKRDRFFKKVRRFFSSDENKLGQAYRMFHKVKQIQTRLNAIVNKHQNFALTVDYKPICLRREETCSYVDVKDIIGRDDDKKAVIEYLLECKDQDVRFLTVVGVGGLGKTALAQLVYNDEDIEREFGDLRFWVCVSDQDKQQFDKKAIMSKILKLVTKGQRSFDAFEWEQLQLEFQKELGGKKYMLVLDDVWNEDRVKWVDMQKFLKKGRGGSRVLITTRSEITATIIGDDEHTYRLQGLSPGNSWALFEMVAFNKGNHEKEEFLETGDKIVAECYNIPLAIKVVGSLLYGQDITKWRSFEKSGLAGICNGDNEIMSILKLSYHNLTPSLKSCFTYCAVFPKDFIIRKEKLIQLWMAQGYVVSFDRGQTIDDAAEEHFSILLRRCFFQDVRIDVYGDIESVKIHDLMHDVAQEVAGEEIQLLGSGGNGFGDEVCHLSFDGDNCPQSSSSRNKLRSYIHLSPSTHGPAQVVLHNFIFLRVLEMKYLDDIKSLESIGELLHLRYLDLCESSLEAFPASSITKLHNLQTLKLSYCYKLRELPHEFSKLKKLRHLEIIKCPELICMPSGMDKLTSLRKLNQFVVGRRCLSSGKKCDEEFKNLETLTNLTGFIWIYISEKYKNVEQPMNGSFFSQMTHLKRVHICFERCITVNQEAVLEKLEPHPNLKVLDLTAYNGMIIPWWRKAENNRAISSNLVHITITWCWKLQTMPSLGKLPYLKSLSLNRLSKLEYMEETGSSSSHAEAQETLFFPSLEYLELYRLFKLKGWFRGEGLAGADHCLSRRFPRLFHLEIRECLNLASFPSCPSVKAVHCNKSRILTDVVGRGYGTSCLATLTINDDKELKSLSEMSDIFMSCATSLRSLRFCDCPNLESISEGLEHLTVLESLQLVRSTQVNISEDDIMPWKSLNQSLRTLVLHDLDNVTSLPKGMQHLTSLQTLDIGYCINLEALPEWITCLSSLQHLQILQPNANFSLIKRCRKPDGADWPKIQHIPNSTIKTLM